MSDTWKQVVADRDRLRTVVEATKLQTGRLKERAEGAEAERDRLRAVVDAARAYVAMLDGHRATPRQQMMGALSLLRTQLRQVEVAEQEARLAREQLDVSPTMGESGFGEAGQAAIRDMADRDETVLVERDSKIVEVPAAHLIDPTSPTYDPDQYGTFTQADGARNSPLGNFVSADPCVRCVYDHPPGSPCPNPRAATPAEVTIGGWGVWHADDEEWIGFGATNGIAAELIPEGPGYEHLLLRPVFVQIEEVTDDRLDDLPEAPLRDYVTEDEVEAHRPGKNEKRAEALTTGDRAAPSSQAGSEPADVEGSTISARFLLPTCPACGEDHELVKKFNGGNPIEFFESPCACEPVYGHVTDAGGGHVVVVVDRSTVEYPVIGTRVVLYKRKASSTPTPPGDGEWVDL